METFSRHGYFWKVATSTGSTEGLVHGAVYTTLLFWCDSCVDFDMR